MSSYGSTCQELETYQDDTCNDGTESGKIGYIVVKDTGDTWNYSDAAEYESRIAAGTIVKIAIVGGEKPAAEPITGDARAFGDTRTTNQTHTLTFTDNNAVNNGDFYNSLRQQQGTKSILYVTEGYVWDVEQTCSFAPQLVSSRDGEVVYNVNVTWRKISDPTPYTKPTGTLFA